MMKRILGSEMTFAMTFSRPRFSVLQEPQMAAPASQSPFSSRWEPMVTTATQLLASPLMKSPLEMGHPLAADFFSAIAHHLTKSRAITPAMKSPTARPYQKVLMPPATGSTFSLPGKDARKLPSPESMFTRSSATVSRVATRSMIGCSDSPAEERTPTRGSTTSPNSGSARMYPISVSLRLPDGFCIEPYRRVPLREAEVLVVRIQPARHRYDERDDYR